MEPLIIEYFSCSRHIDRKAFSQAGLVIADQFTDNAADTICCELGFSYAVDWINILDESFILRYYGMNDDVMPRVADPEHLLTNFNISDIYCGNEAEKFDRDCTYNVKRVYLNETGTLVHPALILSCNPRPGT